jgi:hypothetical protein
MKIFHESDEGDENFFSRQRVRRDDADEIFHESDDADERNATTTMKIFSGDDERDAMSADKNFFTTRRPATKTFHEVR